MALGDLPQVGALVYFAAVSGGGSPLLVLASASRSSPTGTAIGGIPLLDTVLDLGGTFAQAAEPWVGRIPLPSAEPSTDGILSFRLLVTLSNFTASTATVDYTWGVES